MGNHTVSGLLRKKRELLARQYQLQTQLVEVARLITVVNESLALFDPEAATKPLPAPRPYKAYFKSGELLRMIIDAIKTAPEAPTMMEIIEQIRQKHETPPPCLRGSVWEAIRRLMKRNVVERGEDRDGLRTWAIVARSARPAAHIAKPNGSGSGTGKGVAGLRLV